MEAASNDKKKHDFKTAGIAGTAGVAGAALGVLTPVNVFPDGPDEGSDIDDIVVDDADPAPSASHHLQGHDMEVDTVVANVSDNNIPDFIVDSTGDGELDTLIIDPTDVNVDDNGQLVVEGGEAHHIGGVEVIATEPMPDNDVLVLNESDVYGTIDLDEDGQVDALIADVNGNDIPDLIIDSNGDGNMNALVMDAFDENGDLVVDYGNVLHREVAIKVLEVKTTADGKKTFSLKDEFEALNHVPKHPNIANYEDFYSYEMPNGIFDYAVVQYYPDGNLGNAIKQGLTAEQKEDVAMQLLEGIDFLHKHKVVHRDLKPGNILIVKHGGRIIPLITDFGLSKAAGVVDGSVFSNSFGAGTPRYSSPEQLQGNPLRLNTDLWSYGAILYELFTGEQLFSAGSGAANTAQADMEIYNKIVNGNVKSFGKMPETWRRVAERCLVVDPTQRAKDAGELLGIVKGDEDETEIGGPSTGSGTATGRGPRGNDPSSDPGRPSPSERGQGGVNPHPRLTTNPQPQAVIVGLTRYLPSPPTSPKTRPSLGS